MAWIKAISCTKSQMKNLMRGGIGLMEEFLIKAGDYGRIMNQMIMILILQAQMMMELMMEVKITVILIILATKFLNDYPDGEGLTSRPLYEFTGTTTVKWFYEESTNPGVFIEIESNTSSIYVSTYDNYNILY